MIKRPFGWTKVEVPVIGQGTWMIEGEPDREKRPVETLRLGLDLGLTHIDTAEMYGDGRVEQLLAEAIVGRRDGFRLLPQCTQEQIAIVAYSPFGHGKFPGVHNAGGRLLAEIAERHGQTPRQVALNFLTRHPNVFAIPKTTDPDRVKENAGAVGWKLSAQEMDAIDRAFPAPAFVTTLGTL